MSNEVTQPESYEPRYRAKYRDEVVKGFIDSGKYKNVMSIPKMTKITLSCTFKDVLQNPKSLDSMSKELSLIAGQKARITKAKKAISNFKLREGVNLGCMVTLRRDRMFEFFDRFVSVTCPRIRDFKGFATKSFDGRGNYSLGIKEHTVFPEVDYNKVEKIRGFNITIGTTANSDEEALSLLQAMGFPFRKPGGEQ